MTLKLRPAAFALLLLLFPLASSAADIDASGTPDPALAPATETPATGNPKPATTTPVPPAAPETRSTPAAVAPAAKSPAVAPALPATAPAAAPAATAPAKPVAAKPAAALPPKPLVHAPAKPAAAPPAHPAPAVPARPAPAAPSKPLNVPVAPAKPVIPHAATPAKAIPSHAAPAAAPGANILSQAADIELFVREDCPNCDKARDFLAKLQALQPQLKINIRDVRKEPAALELLKRMTQNQGGDTLVYPAFVVSGRLFLGFSDEANTAQQVLDNLPLLHSTSDVADICEDNRAADCGLIPAPPPAKPETLSVELFGYSMPLSQIGLPLYTVAMGMLDGLNFGSTWVLMLMIALLAPLKDRTRMLSVTGTFFIVQAVIYFIVMAAWFNLVTLIDTTRLTQILFALLALAAALVYFKNYLYFGQRLSFATHEIDKPGIYTYIRKIIETQTIIATLAGTVALAIFVIITEFSFKTVFPALYVKVLALHKLGTLGNYGYLALYDFAYMLDDLVILAIGIATLRGERATEKDQSRLKLVSSLLLLATATYLVTYKFS